MPMLDIQPTTPRLSRLGVIRLGIKKKTSSGKEYPAEVDHFVLRDAPELVAAYGDAPTELLIYLPYDSLDENLVAWHELWYKAGLVCRGNGETIQKLVKSGVGVVIADGEVILPYADRAQDGSTPEFVEGDRVRCPGLDHNLWARCAQCKPSAMLIAMVRDPRRPTQLVNDRLGYYQLRTSSFYNVQNLTGQLLHALDTARAIGHPSLKGIPMILKREQRTITYLDEGGKQKTSTHYLLNLEFDVRWVQVANEALGARALGAGRVQAPALPELVTPPAAREAFAEGELVEEDEAPELSAEMSALVGDLLALRDTPPATFDEAAEVLAGFLGTAYDHDTALRYARGLLGLGRTDRLAIEDAWEHMIAYVYDALTAGAGEPEIPDDAPLYDGSDEPLF